METGQRLLAAGTGESGPITNEQQGGIEMSVKKSVLIAMAAVIVMGAGFAAAQTTNYEIKQFSRNILFDEKIGGTCHLAVGASIPESGGKNQSALHWDMVCNLKKKSRITADGKEIYRNGKFVI